MTLSPQEAFYAAALGAIVGGGYSIGKVMWDGGSMADVTLIGVLAAASVGAVAGVLAFMLRPK